MDGKLGVDSIGNHTNRYTEGRIIMILLMLKVFGPSVVSLSIDPLTLYSASRLSEKRPLQNMKGSCPHN